MIEKRNIVESGRTPGVPTDCKQASVAEDADLVNRASKSIEKRPCCRSKDKSANAKCKKR